MVFRFVLNSDLHSAYCVCDRMNEKKVNESPDLRRQCRCCRWRRRNCTRSKITNTCAPTVSLSGTQPQHGPKSLLFFLWFFLYIFILVCSPSWFTLRHQKKQWAKLVSQSMINTQTNSEHSRIHTDLTHEPCGNERQQRNDWIDSCARKTLWVDFCLRQQRLDQRQQQQRTQPTIHFTSLHFGWLLTDSSSLFLPSSLLLSFFLSFLYLERCCAQRRRRRSIQI